MNTAIDHPRTTPNTNLPVANASNIASMNLNNSFQQANTMRNYPHITIPPRPFNRISKSPSPRKSCGRKTRLNSDVHRRDRFADQLLQQQQSYPCWEDESSINACIRRRQSELMSTRPSSWHCASLEPSLAIDLQALTPISALSYPSQNSYPPFHDSAYFSAPISPDVSSCTSLPLDSQRAQFAANHQFFPDSVASNPSLDSGSCFTDRSWMFDSLPPSNYFVPPPGAQNLHDYYPLNCNLPNNYVYQSNSPTSPPTPNGLTQSDMINRPYLLDGSIPQPNLSKDCSKEEELIGMGLYDDPESCISPTFYSSLDQYLNSHVARACGIKSVQCRESQGKGLKLEETFTPILSDDDDDITDDEENVTS